MGSDQELGHDADQDSTGTGMKSGVQRPQHYAPGNDTAAKALWVLFVSRVGRGELEHGILGWMGRIGRPGAGVCRHVAGCGWRE